MHHSTFTKSLVSTQPTMSDQVGTTDLPAVGETFGSSRGMENLRSRNEFETTDTELAAIAAAAKIGMINPIAAIGINAVLYPKAQNRFCLIVRIVFLLN